MKPYYIGTAIAVLVLSACSSELKVMQIVNVSKVMEGESPSVRTELTGIPFRIKERYRITVYEKGETKYEEILSEQHTLANVDQLYTLNFRGGVFSDATAAVELNNDGTIKKVDVGATDRFNEVLTELGAQGIAVATTVRDQKKAREDAAKAKRQAATDAQNAEEAELVGQEDSTTTALKAENAARLAIAELNALSENSTAIERLVAENKVGEAQRQANIMARRAGLPLPFPN